MKYCNFVPKKFKLVNFGQIMSVFKSLLVNQEALFALVFLKSSYKYINI